ncbi:MAG: AmmeMemoRadiSam system radical SAM enzyme [Propionibacteriaceae bacterium]|nr:AmmeMemoRadiSam system radical SAM enzyme [Propionibacteriaceae bacterium]
MKATYWHQLDNSSVQCDLCPRRCRLRPGQRGFCFVRENIDGQLDLTTYGRSSGFAVDPIEKKPLYHVLPGSKVLSFGTAGCNLACRFCQNWELSTASTADLLQRKATPSGIAEMAAYTKSHGVAYTYNDPVIFAEYAIDVAQAVREQQLLNIAVTAGYIWGDARADFFASMDATNVDLKSFNPEFYRRIVGGRLDFVLDTLAYIAHETQCWLEITTLLIPGLNDSDDEIQSLTQWIAAELGTSIPLHFSAFHPDNRMQDLPRTPLSTLTRARQIAMDAGLRFVYTGNVIDDEGSTTFCPGCKQALIRREGFQVLENTVGTQGQCSACSTQIPGLWST